MAPSKAAVANSAYAKDERVLCFHHDMLYEAKILDVRKGEEKDGEQNSWKYKIHYKGWKNTVSPCREKNWDDWVSQDRVRKFSDENKELAAQLHNQLKDVKHGKSSKKRTQGSDFSSARGSEERHASTAAQNGRGAASRRNRDYDLDNPVAESKNGPTAPSPQRLILTLKTHSPPEFKARLAAELERNGVSGNGSKSFTQSPPAQSEAFTLLPITPPTSKHKRKRKASVAKNSTPNKKTRPTLRYSKMFSRALRAQRYPPSQLIDHEIEEDEEDESDDEVQVQVKVGNGGEDEPDDANGPVPATEGNRASRTTRRSGDLVALDVDGSIFRRKAMSSWNDPKSEDWDVLRVLHDDDMLAKDNLLRLPPKNFTYIDSNGKLRDPNKYHEVKPSSSTPPHPKLVYHMKNGTDTPTLRKYYEDMPRNRNIPIAGMVDIPETGSGWEPDLGLRGQKAQQNKAIEIKAKAKIDIRSLEVRDTNDDSSSPSSLTSTEEVTFPGMLEKFSDEQSSYEHDPEKYYMVLARLTKAILTGNKIYQEDTFHAKPMVQLPVPDHIKAILVDDWENVTKNQQLVPLPAKVSVTVILDDYIEYESGRRLTGTPQSDLLPEVVTGLKEYFEKCLGRVLLYRFERSQYQEVREGMGAKEGEFAGKTICDIYGAEHLCRLIVTLPELIAQTNMDTQSVNRLREELTKMTMWLGKNASKYFNNEYETPGAEYIEKARSG
ncbi:hypothetical protein QTJ16_005151 [Diplocarpon rosae]|uniref:Chromatin modification-related protein EAF3 n=1 Tax=Diplocarpon rosae TaxID=946125 RepID=A0AAD9SZJ3_9HELO|nr:hypothetical protein QTJ16_005151 [Diplocarpon rosae]